MNPRRLTRTVRVLESAFDCGSWSWLCHREPGAMTLLHWRNLGGADRLEFPPLTGRLIGQSDPVVVIATALPGWVVRSGVWRLGGWLHQFNVLLDLCVCVSVWGARGHVLNKINFYRKCLTEKPLKISSTLRSVSVSFVCLLFKKRWLHRFFLLIFFKLFLFVCFVF